MGAAKAQSRTTNEFQRSNSTTNAFIGGKQKAWMTNPSSELTQDSCTAKPSKPKALDQLSETSYRADLASEVHKSATNNKLSETTIGTNTDSIGDSAQRRRQGETRNHANRSPTSLAAGSVPRVLSPPAFEENPGTPPANSMDVSTSAENVLPSPSPSVEAPQNSANMTENEDERHQPQAAEAPPVDGPMTILAELENLLNDSGESKKCPNQLAASGAKSEFSKASPSSAPRQQALPPDSMNRPRSDSDRGVPNPSIAHKRAQEVTDEPRKRLRSLPSLSSKDSFATPSATVVLPSPSAQSSTATSTSEIEMHQISLTILQRMQMIANLPDREGVHVERPRLELLREACESSDLFYLVLHQLFCLEHEVRRLNGQILGLNEMHRKGLDVVNFLLVSNKTMTSAAVSWFSNFPLPLGDLITKVPKFASAHAKVLRFLEKMATFWNDMRDQCTKRIYPPLVDELVVLYNVESFLVQQIIFRAVLRDIWSGNVDDCFHITEEIFNKDYRTVMSRLLLGSATVELVKLYQQAVVTEYQHALGSHWQHAIAGPTRSMAPPLRRQSHPRLAPANPQSKNRNMSQPGRNKNTQGPLTLDLQTAQRHSLSAASGSAPIAMQATQSCRPGNISSQSQALGSNALLSPHFSNLTQSPTPLQGFFSPGASVISPGPENGQQHQSERRASSAAGSSFGAVNNPRRTSQATTPTQRTSHILPSSVPGNVDLHQLQQNLGLQQHSHNRAPSSSYADPRPHSQSEFRRSSGSQTSETILPTISPHPFILSYPPLPTHPNPITSALHQAHLRSPTLSYSDPNNMGKCFRFINFVLMPPEELDSTNPRVNWDFNVNRELAELFAPDCPNSHGAPSTRKIFPGSRLWRIRCISLENRVGMPSQSEWAVADNVWPGSTAVVLNGIALDIRKKTHHGKDLPIDVTSHIRTGQNNISTAVIGFQKDSTARFAIGLELIQVVNEQNIIDTIRILPLPEARKRILDQSKSFDPDIEVIQSQKVLDLTDPFTARIFDVPIRGINCHHNQCFDRDTFLQTRTAKVPGEPCGPDEFRCPICGQDARPESLMIDTFFVNVRVALKQRGRLDAKAIILYDSGEWDIKEEEEASGEPGDGTGRRSTGLAAARSASTPVARQSAPREVIAIDDD